MKNNLEKVQNLCEDGHSSVMMLFQFASATVALEMLSG